MFLLSVASLLHFVIKTRGITESLELEKTFSYPYSSKSFYQFSRRSLTLLKGSFDKNKARIPRGKKHFVSEEQFSFLMSSKIIQIPPAASDVMSLVLSPGCAHLPDLASDWSLGPQRGL